MYTIYRAESPNELEEVFRFRYDHCFRDFPPGYPGLDHARQRLFEPHDLDSEHMCARDAGGRLVAVSTATPAHTPSAPAAWTAWLGLDRLRPLGLARFMVSTRMVLHRQERGGELFTFFYKALKRRYVAAGLLASLHYCRPGLVSRYQHLGHHAYAPAFNLPGGQLRQPMLVCLNPVQDCLLAVFPDLEGRVEFHRLPAAERRAYVEERLLAAGVAALPEAGLPALRRACPLPVAQGQTLYAGPAEAQLCCILAGWFREERSGGLLRLGPGAFLGRDGDRCVCAARAETAGELLVFDSAVVRRALDAPAGQPADAAALWRALGASVGAHGQGSASAASANGMGGLDEGPAAN